MDLMRLFIPSRTLVVGEIEPAPTAPMVAAIETGAFVRDVRTPGETPCHRAAACADAETIDYLLDHGTGWGDGVERKLLGDYIALSRPGEKIVMSGSAAGRVPEKPQIKANR